MPNPNPAALLIVYAGHPGGRVDRLRQAAEAGIAAAGTNTPVVLRYALECTTDDVLAAAGYLLMTPEHFGYMSGALKHFFDCTYYPTGERTQGRPYALVVSAGNDGTGTVRSVERIVTGYRWNAVAPALVIVGEPSVAQLDAVRELAATLAVGLEAGIF